MLWLCGLPTVGQEVADSLKAEEDQQRNRKIRVLPTPSFGYSPETSLSFGVVSLFTFNLYQDSLTRTSNAKVKFIYTLRRQSILESQWNYFFREEKWFTDGELSYSRYPDLYYGVGQQAEQEDEATFTSNRFLLRAHLLKRIQPKLFAGIGVRHIRYSNVTHVTHFPELRSQSNLELSVRATYDTRNNLLNSTKGQYVNINAGYNLGSSQDYVKLIVDLRAYKTWKDRYTIAARFYNEFNDRPPNFYDYALLGGDRNGRGYFYGRYRDRNLSTLQFESRVHLFWRLGLAVFGGVSAVYGSANSGTLKVFPNVGGGIRILMDKKGKVNLRLDYGLGQNGQSGFYGFFGESF